MDLKDSRNEKLYFKNCTHDQIEDIIETIWDSENSLFWQVIFFFFLIF